MFLGMCGAAGASTRARSCLKPLSFSESSLDTVAYGAGGAGTSSWFSALEVGLSTSPP